MVAVRLPVVLGVNTTSRLQLADEFEVGFAPALLLKDLKICRSLCEDVGFESAVVRQAIADYSTLVDSGDK